jgi:predicted transglutaminase-like cysteine proteinase
MSTGESTNRRKGAPHARVGIAAASVVMAILVSSMPAYSFLARPAIFAAIGTVAKAPSGWLQFCAESPEECRPGIDPPRDVVLTPEMMPELFSVNKYANERVKWTSDASLYGKAERWALPFDRGDCEDIVLLKRKLLAKAGWPLSALLITTVEQRGTNMGHHAVLTVRTDRGELILDNQTPEILFWYETNYRYLTRQTPTDPNIWVSFRTEQPQPDVITANR